MAEELATEITVLLEITVLFEINMWGTSLQRVSTLPPTGIT
jgi:hypothetical protein